MKSSSTPRLLALSLAILAVSASTQAAKPETPPRPDASCADPYPNSDCPYYGSTFNEVRRVVFDDDSSLAPASPEEAAELASYRTGKLPHIPVTWKNFHRRIGGALVNLLERATKRTVTEEQDYYRRFEKLVHSNGICFAGDWEITESTPYTGSFAGGTRALFIGRASVANDHMELGRKRPFGFAGKIFPTTDPDARVRTANFVTINNLGGLSDTRFLDVGLTNEPALGFAITPITSLNILFAFLAADRRITFRPIDPIAETGLSEGASPVSPHWMMLRADPSVPRNGQADFRDELSSANFPAGLVFDLYGSDTTKDASSIRGWDRLGRIRLRESIVSYGCDRRLHFHHNKVRN